MRTFIRTVLHFIANWFFNSLCLYACSQWLPGMTLTPDERIPLYLLVMEIGLVLTLMNTGLRPVLLLLLLPLNGMTLGLFSVVLSGAFIGLLSRFTSSFQIANFWTGISATFLFAILNMVLQFFIPLDDDIIYYSILGQRRAAKNSKTSRSHGIVMLEIDGLSYSRLLHAIESGRMPFLHDLQQSGAFTIHPYDCGVPSQTSSCQAGIMYGRNENICAFRWYDKSKHRVFSSNSPSDAADMERMLFADERPTGILNHGMSINNIISGNAAENIFTVSRLIPGSREELGRVNRDMYYFSLRPYLMAKSIVLTIFDAGREVLLYFWDVIRRKTPRLNRLHGFYPFVRGATNILLRDISTAMVADAVAGGKEAIYTTFIGYDEIAHHSGPDSFEAYNALGGIDRSIRKIYEAIQITNARHYELVILSDHGQSYGATFKQRYGISLGDYIQNLAARSARKALEVVSVEDNEDNNANVMAVLNAFSGKDRHRLIRKTTGNLKDAIGGNEKDAIEAAEEKNHDILVLASGNLVNAYFQVCDERLTYEEIEEYYPGMISGLTEHPGVGAVFVHSAEGPLAFGVEGCRNLATGEISGMDPLIMYEEPELRAEQLRYLLDFPSGGDLVIISPVYEDGTVAAYEELIGSHGGLGGQQTEPFLMYSTAIKISHEIHNSRDVYPVLKKIKGAAVAQKTSEKGKDDFSLSVLMRQLVNVKDWIFTLARTLLFSPTAYRDVARNEAYNGPAIFIGLLSFINNWYVMNRFFGSEDGTVLTNLLVLLIIYGIEILAAYLTIIIFRGKRHPWVLTRTILFTNYFSFLWLFTLSHRALSVWIPVILVLRVTTLASSAITAGELNRRFSIPVFLILVILIPVLVVAVLLIYNFISFISTGKAEPIDVNLPETNILP